MPDEAIPEAIADLIAEIFERTGAGDRRRGCRTAEDKKRGSKAAEGTADHTKTVISQARGKDATRLKAALIRAKQKLMDLDSDIEALEQQQQMEIEVITKPLGKRPKERLKGTPERNQGRP